MILLLQTLRDMHRAEVLQDPANAIEVITRVETERGEKIPDKIKVLVNKHDNGETFTPDELELLIAYTSDLMFENLDEEIDFSCAPDEENGARDEDQK